VQIVVRQLSGLGNQLFQYAAGLYYARKHGASLRIAIEPSSKGFSHGYARPVLLSNFSIPEPIEVIGFRDRLFLSKKIFLQPALSRMKSTLRIQIVEEEMSQRYRFLQSLPIQGDIETLYLVGYWQAHRIADDNAAELRSSLRFKELASGKNLEVLNKIRASQNPVSLHIRRGDYTLAAEGNIALPIDYYHRAINCLRQHLSSPTFLVFSDDISYARQNLPADLNAVFVDHNDDFSSHEDLRLMSSCRHHIIANSTFSWWGAWLNPREDKIVYAPKQWLLKPDSVYPDLIPPAWRLLDL
jgi:hypothetical protein